MKRFFFLPIILSVFFIVGLTSVASGQITYNIRVVSRDTTTNPASYYPRIGVTMLLGQGISAINAPVNEWSWQIAITDGNGRFSTATPCPAEGTSVHFKAIFLRADGLIEEFNDSVASFCIPQVIDDNYVVSAAPGLNGALQNAGSACSVGRPVNVTNGNLWLTQTDFALAGGRHELNVSRTYNSVLDASGLFGFGWTSDVEERLMNTGAGGNSDYLQFQSNDGRAYIFGRASTGVFSPATAGFFGSITYASNQFTLTFKDGRIHRFDQYGNLISKKDRNGNETTFAYTNNQLTGISDPFGHTLTITPNANGKVGQISDLMGVVATYEYDLNGIFLKTVTYADGSKYKFEYVTVGTKTYLATVKDAFDNIIENHDYDSQGRATTSEVQGGVEKYTLNYDHIGDAVPYTTVTDALGRITKHYFDTSKGQNVITKTEGLCACGNGSETTTFEYDSKLNLTKTTDALLNQTTFTYDANGNRLTQTDFLGTQKFTYNSFGQILTYKDRIDFQNQDPNVYTQVNTYSTTGNLLTSKDALNNTTTLTYTSLGQLATAKDALNHTTTLTYDAFGRLTQVKDANNKTTNVAYDARVRPTSVTNALSETTSFEYDLNNRLKKVIYPDTNFTEFTYDLAGRRTAVKDARGNTTTYGYDAAYRLTSMTDALSHVTTYHYDLMSNMDWQKDALNNTTNYEYDDFNRLKKMVYPPATTGGTRLEENLAYDTVGNVKTRVDTAGKTTLYDYDNANRLIKTTDALSQITQFEYNARSQMTKVTDALSQQYVFTYDPLGRQVSQTRSGSTMSFIYDAIGNRTKRTDYTGRETSYEYDVLNRLKKINYLSAGNSVPLGAATYNYDDLSRLTSAVNDAGVVAFTYDNRNRIKTTADVFGHVVEYGYDQNGNRTQLKLDGTVHTAYAYDVSNRLTTLTDEVSQSFTFGYDIANRLISKTLPNGISSTFDYDGISRLTRLKHQSSAATLTDNNFAYNPANLISQITELTQTKNFSYDNVDRLTGMTNGSANENYVFDSVGNRTSSQRSAAYGYQPFNRLASTSTATYSYNANGNMLSKSDAAGFWIYGWDYENRMITARKQNKIVRYQYDALGRRVSRIGKTLGSTKYVYDGLDVVMDDDFEMGIVKYQNGPGIDDKLKMVVGGQAKYFLQDHLGSTTGLTDSTGAVTSSASYDSFGNSTNNLTTRYQFTGREFDNFTGLQYSRARWYDAGIGRFISEDPIGFDGGDVNLYAYTGNSPLRWTDPHGLYPWSFGENPYDIIPEAGWVGIAYTGNFAAGFGDHVTTIPFTDIKLTKEARKLFGSDAVVDPCSGIYSAGEWSGLAWEIAFGGVGGLRSAGTRGVGKEFSHWVPARLGGSRSLANGNYVSIAEHALSDPYRYRFMPRVWKSNNPLPNIVSQQWSRIPNVYKGIAAGTVVGASQIANQCECK
jgi:RHS repeat-associated protein